MALSKELPSILNPFEQEGNWFRANFHTHTTTSDGDTPLADRLYQYRENGYAVLAVTDHDQTNDIARFCSKNFLVISGMETHPPCLIPGEIYHLACLNIPSGFKFPEKADVNERIAMVKDAGGEVIYAHPYWCGHNINHIVPVKGFLGIEVFNATCTKIGKGYSNVQWDDLLDCGLKVFGFANDDTHNGRDIFMGWTMLKTRELTLESVMNALRTGCFYSSCGPAFQDFRVRNGKVVVECSPAAEIHLIGQRCLGQSAYADDGPDLVAAEMDLHETTRYIRAEIVDRKGRRAWTNPIFLKM